MEFDFRTAKLLSLLAATNFVAAAAGFAAASLFDPLIGLAVVILMLLSLPLPIQYIFLKRELEERTVNQADGNG